MALGVYFDDPLPAEVAFLSCSATGVSGASCGGPPVGSGGTVRGGWFPMSAGLSVRIVLAVQVAATSGTITNTAHAWLAGSYYPPIDPNPTNNSSTVTTTILGPGTPSPVPSPTLTPTWTPTSANTPIESPTATLTATPMTTATPTPATTVSAAPAFTATPDPAAPAGIPAASPAGRIALAAALLAAGLAALRVNR